MQIAPLVPNCRPINFLQALQRRTASVAICAYISTVRNVATKSSAQNTSIPPLVIRAPSFALSRQLLFGFDGGHFGTRELEAVRSVLMGEHDRRHRNHRYDRPRAIVMTSPDAASVVSQSVLDRSSSKAFGALATALARLVTGADGTMSARPPCPIHLLRNCFHSTLAWACLPWSRPSTPLRLRPLAYVVAWSAWSSSTSSWYAPGLRLQRGDPRKSPTKRDRVALDARRHVRPPSSSSSSLPPCPRLRAGSWLMDRGGAAVKSRALTPQAES